MKFTKNSEELLEMANIHPNIHGIIWVGQTNSRHRLRIKVSNKKDRFDFNDHFNIQMPSLNFDPTKVAKWITPICINAILSWIKLNQQLLVDYETGKVDNTYKFLQQVSKV